MQRPPAVEFFQQRCPQRFIQSARHQAETQRRLWREDRQQGWLMESCTVLHLLRVRKDDKGE